MGTMPEDTDLVEDSHYLSDDEWAAVVVEAERIAAEREGEKL